MYSYLACPPLSATDCPLFASVPFLGYLCVFSCMPQLAPMSVSARFLVYFYVHCCRPLCMADLAHGQWTSKLHAATAVFLKYCQTKGYKFSAYLVVTNQAMVIVPYNDRQGCKLLMVWSKEGKGKRLPAHQSQ